MEPRIFEIKCQEALSAPDFNAVLTKMNVSPKAMRLYTRASELLEKIKNHTPDFIRKIVNKTPASTHNMTWYEWGDSNSKDVIVCVHGMTRNGRDFDFLAQALAERGCRVICPDIAGRGKSEWLSNPALYGYPLYVRDIISLMHHLNLSKVKWVGTSMGGLIGMMIAASMPNLITKMVLNDIGPFIPKESLERIGSYVGKNNSFPNKEQAEEYLKTIMSSFGLKEVSHWEHVLEHTFVRGAGGSYVFAYDPAIGHAFWNSRGKQRKSQDVDLWPMWKTIHCPIMILRGADSDLLTKEIAEKMKEAKNVEDLVEIPKVGHAPMLMDYDQIEVVRNWLLKK